MHVSSSAKPETLAARLQRARNASFVGRVAELELWTRALSEGAEDFAVLWVVGPGGVGKTTLLQRFSSLAQTHGLEPTWIDVRHVLCPDSFLGAVADALGAADGDPWPILHDDRRRVLLIDTAEELGALETYLRDRFLPALSERCLVVLAGRTPPGPELVHDAGWAALIRVLTLGNLESSDAAALLEARGIDVKHHEALLRSTSGHPLALSLSADVIAQERGVMDPGLAMHSPDVIGGLLARFSHRAPDALHRSALQVAAHARITDEALLRHVVDEERASELYDWLASLSFSVLGQNGLYLHDLAAQALDISFRRRDPQAYQAMHTKVREPCVHALRTGSGVTRLRAAADVSWMNRFNPVMGALVDWESSRWICPDGLQAQDHGQVIESTRYFQGEGAASAIVFWLQRRPEAFTIVRSESGKARGYLCNLTLKAEEVEDAEVLKADPRVAAAARHFDSHGILRPGERVAYELWLDYELGQRPGPMTSQQSMRQLSAWLGKPGVAWSVIVVDQTVEEVWKPLLAHTEHAEGPTVCLGEAQQVLYVHDWRIMTPDRFLRLMAEREVFGGDAVPAQERVSQFPLVLSQKDFYRAARDALKNFTDEDRLSRSQLMRCRAVLTVPTGSDHPVRRALLLAMEPLAASAKDERAYGALKLTYIDPARTQEEAAELLSMAFSTYRRHLSAGVERVLSYLWERELQGY